jgi:manganese/iron transport system permease protein
MLDPWFWMPVICSGVLIGGTTGMLGTFIVGMRIPFLGVCISHAALAGAVFGSLAGWTGPMLMLPALAGAVAAAMLLGILDIRSTRLDSNVLLGMLFSLTMGLSFLGLGLFSAYGISDNEVRGLLWGNLNFCRWSDFYGFTVAGIVEAAVVLAFFKELRAILFSREHAAAAGVRTTLVWTILLTLISVVLTVNFQSVGGLMIYGLLTNPAIAAFRLVRGFGASLACSTALGALSGLAGFLAAAWLDLPTGAMIVIVSSLLIGLAVGIEACRNWLWNFRSIKTGRFSVDIDPLKSH